MNDCPPVLDERKRFIGRLQLIQRTLVRNGRVLLSSSGRKEQMNDSLSPYR